jgi:PAS domain S-box-containing protein
MLIEVLLALSAAVQLGAAGFAFWLVRVSGHRRGWVVIAIALLLMALRRVFALAHVLSGGPPPASVEMAAEAAALGASTLLLVGVAILTPAIAGSRRAGAAIRESERHFRTLIENSLDLVVVLDQDALVRYVGPSVARVLGRDPEKILGTDALAGVHPDDRERVREFFSGRVRRPGVAPPIEFRFRHKDGSWRHLEAVANNLLGDPALSAIVVNARDVTERQQAVVARARAEARLERVIANAPVVFFGLDAQGTFTLSEGRGLATLGLVPGEVVGRSVFDVYRGFPDVCALMRRVLAGEQIHDLVPVGDVVFDVWCAPVPGEGGQPAGALGVATDVTDRERAWHALQESESVYRTLIEQSSDAIYVLQDDRFVLVNRAWEALFGYSRVEALAPDFDFTKIITPASLAMVGERARRRAAGQPVPSPYEMDARARDGRVVNLEVTVADIVWRGRPAVQGIYHDVTERRRAEEALRRSEADYRTLVEHAAYGIYRSTPDGQFLAVNSALVRMLGYGSERELLSTDLPRDIYADPSQRLRLMDQYRDADLFEGVEAQWKRKDGTPVLVRLSGRPVRRSGGEIECYEMIVEDVTDRKALEEQLRQAQKMEAIGQLASGIAHDFNNILTVILANADIIERGMPADRPELTEDLGDLRRAARRGSDMVRKLLGYSRRGMLSVHPVNLSDSIAGLLPMLRRLIPEHIEIRFEARTAEAIVRADEGAIEQILLNLATNARDAMPEGGMLELEVGRDLVGPRDVPLADWGAAGEFVVVSVKDTGHGMDAATRQRLFEPFFTTKPPGVGTGLGMAMVYGLVKQLGGFIDVHSAPGKGTQVVLYLPVGESSDTMSDRLPPPVPADRAGTETILLVEDEPAIRRSAKRLLERNGYTVLVAGDGDEALKMFADQESRIDLVISDVVMPKVGGPQLYETLKQRKEGLRFLFTSGYTRRDVRESGAIDPRVPFVQKPWDVDEFLHRVRVVLDEKGKR